MLFQGSAANSRSNPIRKQKHTGPKSQDRVEYYPLSLGQQALWFLHQSDPQSCAYNIAFSVKIVSPVNFKAMHVALQTLLYRHPALRTIFAIEEGHPVQVVKLVQDVSFEIINVSELDDEEIHEKILDEYKRPFVLIRGPLFRATLFVKSDVHAILILLFHHIICDAPSIKQIVQDFKELYAADLQNREPNLIPLKKNYFDYVATQEQLLKGNEGHELWKYWSQQLKGKLPLLLLPNDHPRQAVYRTRGGYVPFKLSSQLTDELSQIAQQHNISVDVLLLTAYLVLLYRCSGQRDITIGVPSPARYHQDFNAVVGYFVNSVVIRAQIDGYPAFTEFLKQIAHTTAEAFQHQNYPFSRLVERLQPNRDTSRTPLFQTMFVYKEAVIPELAKVLEEQGTVNFGELELQPYFIPQMAGQFDLMLEFMPTGGSLLGYFKYNLDLFNRETVERFSWLYQTLLQSIVDTPHETLTKLRILPELQKQKVIYEWNQTRRDYDLSRCLHHLIEDQVRRTPNQTAVLYPGHENVPEQFLTYQELNQKANQLAHFLQDHGVGPDILVGVCMERSLEMVIALLGILKAGGAYVPLDPVAPKERLLFTIQDSHVPVLLTQERFVEKLRSEIGLEQVSQEDLLLLPLDTKWEPCAQKPTDAPVCAATPDHLAYAIYTSGSTGKPKGALNTHIGICNRLLWMQETYPLAELDFVVQKTPYTFDVSVWEFFWPLMTGAQLIIAKPEGHKDSTYLVQFIQEQQITTLHFVPSMLQAFVNAPDVRNCTSIKRVICSGEALPYELQERFFKVLSCELHNLYGPTEAAIDVTYWQCKPQQNRTIVPIGRPIANTQIYILDKHMQPVPIGVAGELHIGGVQVARGYLARPELTAEKFIPDPFSNDPNVRLYKSGDLARFLPDGSIEYLARIDKQVKIRGHRIEIGEIDTVLARHEKIREVVVMARVDHHHDQNLVAYFVPRETPPPNTSELRQYLIEHLPEYMIPSVFIPLEAVPLSPNGKIDYASLPMPDIHRPQLAAKYVEPTSKEEKTIAEIWQQVLQIDKVGIHDHFFELGGHSLHLGQVQNRLRKAMNHTFSMTELFKYPTIHSLLAYWRKKNPA